MRALLFTLLLATLSFAQTACQCNDRYFNQVQPNAVNMCMGDRGCYPTPCVNAEWTLCRNPMYTTGSPRYLIMPTRSPSAPSAPPTPDPSPLPMPVTNPTSMPSIEPSTSPSIFPSEVPSTQPTVGPTEDPTQSPVADPTRTPSTLPTEFPSVMPTFSPTEMPTCEYGGCAQDGVVNASCSGGGCNQTFAVNATCAGGGCNQTFAIAPSCNNGTGCNQDHSIGASCFAGGCDQKHSSEAVCEAGGCDQKESNYSSCDGGGCGQVGSTFSRCDGGGCDAYNAAFSSCDGGLCGQVRSIASDCQAGGCYQDYSINATCDGGQCSQSYSKWPICGGGNCNQAYSHNPLCSEGCNQEMCSGVFCEEDLGANLDSRERESFLLVIVLSSLLLFCTAALLRRWYRKNKFQVLISKVSLYGDLRDKSSKKRWPEFSTTDFKSGTFQSDVYEDVDIDSPLNQRQYLTITLHKGSSVPDFSDEEVHVYDELPPKCDSLRLRVQSPRVNREVRTNTILSLNKVFERWEIKKECITRLEKVGRGQFGTVYLAKYMGALVALKEVHSNGAEDRAQKAKILEEEGKLWAKLPFHPHLCKFLGYIRLEGQITSIVTEWVANKSVLDCLKSKLRLVPHEKYDILRQVASAVFCLHESNFVHRDLALRNVLIDLRNMCVKVTDFGLTRLAEIRGENCSSASALPIAWSAPESVRLRQYSTKTDVWSFAVVCWELMTESTPFKGENLSVLALGISIGEKVLPICTGWEPTLQEICHDAWQYDSSARPSIQSIHAKLEKLCLAE